MKAALVLQRHPHLRWIARLAFVRNWLSRRVWAHLDATPGFREEMALARKSLDEHRTYGWDFETGIISPDPLWPKDGPQPKPPYYAITNEPVA